MLAHFNHTIDVRYNRAGFGAALRVEHLLSLNRPMTFQYFDVVDLDNLVHHSLKLRITGCEKALRYLAKSWHQFSSLCLPLNPRSKSPARRANPSRISVLREPISSEFANSILCVRSLMISSLPM